MPIEERFITFNLNEIYKAIVIKCTQDEHPDPPKGKLLSIELNDEEHNSKDIITAKIQNEDGTESAVDYDRTFFALALVFYCQGSGIPLPQSGQKTLKILEDKIIMKIELERSAEKSQKAA